jgi:hypothetical protein
MDHAEQVLALVYLLPAPSPVVKALVDQPLLIRRIRAQ